MNFATTNTASNANLCGSVETLVDRFREPTPVLLAVWAHPDDESFLGAGLIAEIARRGGRVVTVTATAGEHGTDDPALNPPARLAIQRRDELDAALHVLGAEPAILLGYGDGACHLVPDALGARQVGSIIDHIRPDLVLSFGPDGVTGHPDHRAVARWTRRSVAERGDRLPLITTAAGAAWPEVCVERMTRVGAFWPGYPERTIRDGHWPVDLGDPLLEYKLAALACHASQVGPVREVLGPAAYRQLASAEAYRAANPAASRALRADQRIAA